MRLNARLADARARRAASAAEYCDYLQSPGMTPCFPDDFSQMPTFTWSGWEWRGDCDEPTPLVQPSVESSSNTSANNYEIMTASRDKDYDVNAGGYNRLPADSYAAIDMGKPEVTLAMHAVISGPTSARTGGEIRFSKIDENMTTPSMQLRMDLEAMENELIP